MGKNTTVNCLIEILSVSLLDNYRPIVEEMRQVSKELNIDLGWHYLLDLSWAAQHIAPVRNILVLDAGAGRGVMQWWLAKKGVNVISVDRVSRRNWPLGFRQRYRIQGWRKKDLAKYNLNIRSFFPPRSPCRWHLYPQKLSATLQQWLNRPNIPRNRGKIFVYNQELTHMKDIPSNFVDAIVSISALEHNSHNTLRACVAELLRVLKPGGTLIATLAAAKEQDWFHEPSQGWCFIETTLRNLFDLPFNCSSNYNRYDEFFETLQNCDELRKDLAGSYFKSGKNGMPWGVWNPQYQPVGVVKVKVHE